MDKKLATWASMVIHACGSFLCFYASPVVAQISSPDKSGNNTWHVIGINRDRIASSWVQLKSYESLNENSFRMNAKFTNERGAQIVGRIDVNCKNKDYYFRPNGVMFQNAPWAAIPEGSGVHGLAINYCKNTSAKAEWGYKPETAYLWDSPPIEGDPANAKGDWVEATNTDEAEAYYNTEATFRDGVVVYAFYSRTKKGDRSAAQSEDNTKYVWIRNSCKENLGSTFIVLDSSVPGFWGPPTAGRPGGANMTTRKLFCK
jgi:hypothetical protein